MLLPSAYFHVRLNKEKKLPQTVIPQLRITNAVKSVDFYVHGLGFSIDWEHRFEPGFPVFMQLSRLGQTIFLTEHSGDCQAGGAVYFIVDSADQCWSQFEAKGVRPTNPLATTPWGTREFLVTDPDGNRLRFASNMEGQK